MARGDSLHGAKGLGIAQNILLGHWGELFSLSMTWQSLQMLKGYIETQMRVLLKQNREDLRLSLVSIAIYPHRLVAVQIDS